MKSLDASVALRKVIGACISKVAKMSRKGKRKTFQAKRPAMGHSHWMPVKRDEIYSTQAAPGSLKCHSSNSSF